jgi:histidinol-phosphatase
MAHSDRLAFALDAVYQAGRSTLALFGTGHAVERKADASPVTEADREAERILRDLIAARWPGEGIFGEEEGKSGNQDRRWVIDPIDGTKSFVSGVPLYATLLSFEEAGRATVGVAYFPALDLMLCAEKGQGALADGRAIAVSAKTTLADSVVCCGSVRSFESRGHLEGYLRIWREVLALRTWCDAYGHALVAMGRVEAMLDPVVEHYDVSSMRLIVEEAGGIFCGFDGGDSPNREAISVNRALHRDILERFRR